jgi:hypothetical protein
VSCQALLVRLLPGSSGTTVALMRGIIDHECADRGQTSLRKGDMEWLDAGPSTELLLLHSMHLKCMQRCVFPTSHIFR